MKKEQRIKMLEALADAQESIAKAIRIVQEDEAPSSKTPDNVIKEINKTGPRSPFVLPRDRRPAPTTVPAVPKTIRPDLPEDRPSQRNTSPNTLYAFKREDALKELEKSFKEATTPEARARVRRVAKRFAEQGMVTEEEIAPYMGPGRSDQT